jgi:23S rRNA (guanosine2251-2'-O)-methyltransferase
MNLICGINPVLEALGAGTRHFDRLLVVKGLRNRRVSEAIARASQQGIPLRFEARETLDRMAAGVPHQGVIAVVSAKPVIDIDTLLAQTREPALVVVLDGVEDPRNLGAVLRTIECAGADGVVIPERHSAGLSETVGRSSAGALEYVKVARVGNLAQAIETLKAKGLWVVGFDAEGAERWDAVDYKRPIAVVLGGEGKGIRRLVRERCDHLVSLPLFGHMSSLNVSVAAGIALYEIVRQRGAVPSHVKPIPPRRLHAPEPIVGPAADDAEHDPGAGLARPHAAGEHDAEEREDETEEGPGGIVDIHEEAAWGASGGGPTVVTMKERDSRQGGDRDRSHHRGRDRGRGAPARRDQARPAPQSGEEARRDEAKSAPPEGAAGSAHPEGPGRRHRRRRHGGGRPAGNPAPPADTGRPPSEGQGSGPGQGSAGGPPAHSGRPRRRRRH